MNNDIGTDLMSAAQKVADLLQKDTNEEAIRILDLARKIILSRGAEDRDSQFDRQMQQLIDVGIPQRFIAMLLLKQKKLFAKMDELHPKGFSVFCPVIPHKLVPFAEQRFLLPYAIHEQLPVSLQKLPEHTQNFPEDEPYFCAGVFNFKFAESSTQRELRAMIRDNGSLPLVSGEILAAYAHTNMFASQHEPPIMRVVATGYCKVGKEGVVPVFSQHMTRIGGFPQLQLSCYSLSTHFSPKTEFVPLCLARI
jgi:hypothetical protein